MTYSNDEITAWYDLAGAIVERAAYDLANAFQQVRRYSNKPRSAAYLYWVKVRNDCMLFFRSQWYATLCDVPGEYVIEKIREESRFRKW